MLVRHFPPLILLALVAFSCGSDVPNRPPAAPPNTAPAAAPSETSPPQTAPAPAPSTPTSATLTGIETRLAAIRETYSEINAFVDGPYVDVRKEEAWCDSLDGNITLLRHFEGERLLLLTAHTGIAHHHESTQYYFDEHGLCFIYHISEYSGPPLDPPEVSPEGGAWETNVWENRYYLSRNGELIRHLSRYYEDLNWEDPVDPNTIPNEEVDLNAETRIPFREFLAKWKLGDPEC